MAAKDTTQPAASHVAIIMDGNGRWARRRNRPRLDGHKAGAEAVRRVVEACPDHGVRYLTLFAFSTENWKRSRHEVQGLMALFRHFLRKSQAELLEQGVRVRFIGDRTPLNAKLQKMMADLERLSVTNDVLNLTVAINYGARDEISRAARRMALALEDGRLRADQIGPDTLRGYLDTAALPDPDLVIRSSGEMRISNFLLWQCAYSEFEFSPVLWPDFDAREFGRILMSYGGRERRFGAVMA